MDARSYKDIVFKVLEDRGLDKRFRENPEAVDQIYDLVIDEIGMKRAESNVDETKIKKSIERIFERGDFVYEGCRSMNFFQIKNDGSLNVKFATNELYNNYNSRSLEDVEKNYKIGNKEDNFIMSKKYEAYDSLPNYRKHAYCSLELHDFNKQGLEMGTESIFQQCNVKNNIINRVRTCKEMFERYIPGKDLSPISSTECRRGADLVTASVKKWEASPIVNNVLNLYQKLDDLQERYTGFNNNSVLNLVGARDIKCKSQIELPSMPPENKGNYINVPTEYGYDVYKELSEGEKKEMVMNAYKFSVEKSKHFKETLLNTAQSNPDLQKVVEQLGLEQRTNTVSTENLRQIYDKEKGKVQESFAKLSTLTKSKEQVQEKENDEEYSID